MPNEKYLALLRQGVDAWNKWREKNLTVEVILVEANLRGVNLKGANLDEVCLVKADFQGANLERANLREAELIGANLSYANLSGAFLLEANLNHANLTKASLQQTKLIETRALAANFTEVVLTGACLHNWHINNATKFDGVICEYVYLKYRYGGRNRKPTQQERYPSSRNFVSGEFTKLFRKALETVDLIFHDDVNWEAFDYSLKKVEVENSGIQLDVQSIEKKDDGIFVVKVSVPPDTDNTKIHNCFMQGYYFAHNFLEAQYQVRIEDKDKYITQLFHLLSEVNENQSEVLKRISEIPKYDMRKSSFLGALLKKTMAIW